MWSLFLNLWPCCSRGNICPPYHMARKSEALAWSSVWLYLLVPSRRARISCWKKKWSKFGPLDRFWSASSSCRLPDCLCLRFWYAWELLHRIERLYLLDIEADLVKQRGKHRTSKSAFRHAHVRSINRRYSLIHIKAKLVDIFVALALLQKTWHRASFGSDQNWAISQVTPIW